MFLTLVQQEQLLPMDEIIRVILTVLRQEQTQIMFDTMVIPLFLMEVMEIPELQALEMEPRLRISETVEHLQTLAMVEHRQITGTQERHQMLVMAEHHLMLVMVERQQTMVPVQLLVETIVIVHLRIQPDLAEM